MENSKVVYSGREAKVISCMGGVDPTIKRVRRVKYLISIVFVRIKTDFTLYNNHRSHYITINHRSPAESYL